MKFIKITEPDPNDMMQLYWAQRCKNLGIPFELEAVQIEPEDIERWDREKAERQNGQTMYVERDRQYLQSKCPTGGWDLH